MSRLGTWVLPVSAAAVAAALVAVGTRWGPGVSPDSTGYLETARRLSALWRGSGGGPAGGHALAGSVPPLYPVLLAALHGAGLAVLAAARLVGAAVFALTVLAAGRAGLRAGRSAQASAWAAATVALCPHLLMIHVMAWTEGLFLLFTLVSLHLLSGLTGRSRLRTLPAGLAVCAAMMTRYAGPPLVLTGLIVLARARAPLRRRLTDAALFSLLSCGPLAVWILAGPGAGPGRTPAFHPPTISHLRGAAATLYSLFLPLGLKAWGGWAVWVLAAMAPLVLGLLVRELRRDARRRDGRLLPYGLFAVLYPAFILTAMTFVDAPIPLDYRILSPLLLCLIIAAARVVGDAARPGPGRGRRAAFLAVIWGFTLAWAVRSAQLSADLYADGEGYTARRWHDSRLLDAVRALPADTVLYTNGPDVIGFHTGRPCRALPARLDYRSRRPNAEYPQAMAALEAEVVAGDAAIVWFADMKDRTLYPTLDELRARMPLSVSVQDANGLLLLGPRMPARAGPAARPPGD